MAGATRELLGVAAQNSESRISILGLKVLVGSLAILQRDHELLWVSCVVRRGIGAACQAPVDVIKGRQRRANSGRVGGKPVILGRPTHDYGHGGKRTKALLRRKANPSPRVYTLLSLSKESSLERRGYGVTSDDATGVRRCASLYLISNSLKKHHIS